MTIAFSSYSKAFGFLEPRVQQGQRGLTLVELLVAGLVASLVFVAISQVILSQMSATRRIESGQRFREMANRINYLLSVEGSESADVDFKTATASISLPTECTGGVSGEGALFRLRIPRPDGQYGNLSNISNVYYYSGSSGDLMRCGPLSDEDGVLDHDLSRSSDLLVPAIVSRGTSLSLVQTGTTPVCAIGGNNEVSSDRQIVYRLSFSGVSYASPCAVARAKTIFVCNPPNAVAYFTGAIAGTVMSVSSIESGFLERGYLIRAAAGTPGVSGGTVISSFGSGGSGGTGGIGDYNVTPSQSRGSQSLIAFNGGASFKAEFAANSSVMTVKSAGLVGALSVGQALSMSGTSAIAPVTVITGFISGSGLDGTYTISPPAISTNSNASVTSTSAQVGDCS